MAIEIRYIPVSHDHDLLLVHSAAMQLAGIGGMTVSEQIQFAGTITGNCIPIAGSTSVKFSFDTDHEKKHYLLASVTEPSKTIRQEIPYPLPLDRLPTILFPLPSSGDHMLQRLQDMEQFCFALSHELKTSLAKLQLSLALMEKEQLPPAVVDFAGVIHRSAESLENTLSRLNQIIELGHHAPGVIKKISLPELFNQVKEEYDEMLSGINAQVNSNFNGAKELNYVDIYLRTVLSNVFSNAIKYADNSRPLKLNVSSMRNGNTVVLQVVDNGQGIDMKANGPSLFLPFTRFSSKTQGAGIGLYLVKTMVDRNGGKIEVESEKGKGTIFRFFLKEYDVPSN